MYTEASPGEILIIVDFWSLCKNKICASRNLVKKRKKLAWMYTGTSSDGISKIVGFCFLRKRETGLGGNLPKNVTEMQIL